MLEDMLAGADELVRNFLRLAAEKGRAGEIEDIAREFERLMAREERRLERRADDRARALRRRGAGAILKQIEGASGRKVEATRKVDPT